MRAHKSLATITALMMLVACGGGGDSAPTPNPTPSPNPDPTPSPSTGRCQSSSDATGTYQCVGKEPIALQASGFVTFVGNVTQYLNNKTGEVRSQGPEPRLCAVSNSQGQWHVNTPFGNFSVPAEDEMVTTYKPAFFQGNGDIGGMQMLTPLGGGNLMFTYTNTTFRNGKVTRTATITRDTNETFTCILDESGSTTPTTPTTPETPSAPTYASWNDNYNGKVVLDGSSRQFAVNASTRVVHDYSTNVALNGLTALDGGNVYAQGNLVGSIVLASGKDNTRVAVFRCTNGNNMQITQTQTQWFTNCGSGNSNGGGTTPTTPTSPTATVKWDVINHDYISANPFTRYQVTLRNTGNVRISCRVIFDYEYAKSPGLQADRTTLTTGPIAVGATQQVIMELGDRNFTATRFNTDCSAWPFD